MTKLTGEEVVGARTTRNRLALGQSRLAVNHADRTARRPDASSRKAGCSPP